MWLRTCLISLNGTSGLIWLWHILLMKFCRILNLYKKTVCIFQCVKNSTPDEISRISYLNLIKFLDLAFLIHLSCVIENAQTFAFPFFPQSRFPSRLLKIWPRRNLWKEICYVFLPVCNVNVWPFLINISSWHLRIRSYMIDDTPCKRIRCPRYLLKQFDLEWRFLLPAN